MRHLDEGTIHAWIDGALNEAEAAAVAAHVADCATCAAAAAEARGVVAAASRILLALDDVPAGVLPHGAPPVRGRPSRWTSWPVRVAASIVVVAAGVLATREAVRRDADGADRLELAADTAPAGSSREAAAKMGAAPQAVASRAASAAAPDVRPEPPSAPPVPRRAPVLARGRADRPAAAAVAQVGAEAAGAPARTEPDTARALGAVAGEAARGPRSLRGRVVDASGQPVEGALVVVAGTTIGALTASDGRYVIQTAPPDARAVTVRRTGFVTANVSVEGAGPAREIVVALTPAPLQLGDVATSAAPAEGRRSVRLRNAVSTSPAQAAPTAAAPPSAGRAAEATAAALERSTPRQIEGLRLLEHTLRREDRGRTRAGVEIVDRTQDVHVLTYEARPGVPVRLVVRLPAATAGAARGAHVLEDTTALRTEGQVNVIRWREGDGAELQLSGPLSLAELEALRARVVVVPPR